MADIAMCANVDCRLMNKCYRKNAKAADSWQAYSHFEPESDGKCEYFWPMPGEKIAN